MTTYRGYASHFDLDSSQWIHLSDEECLITFSVPPAVHLCDSNGVPLLNIELKNFQHRVQNATSVVVSTEGSASSVVQMYGFRFTEEETAQRFTSALQSLAQYHQRPYNNRDNHFTSQKAPTKTLQNTTLNPFNTLDPNLLNRGAAQLPGTLPPPQQQYNTGTFNGTIQGKPNQPLLQNFMGDGAGTMGSAGSGTRRKDNTPTENKLKLDGFIDVHRTDEALLLLTEEEEWCNTLTEQIESGNVAIAEDIVAQLAEKMTKVVVTPLLKKKSEIKLLIQVCDKNEGGGTVITETVDPHNTSIAMLKYQIFRKYQFPMEIQMWIIGKHLGKDEDTLAQCGVKATGTTIFLYLKSTEKQDQFASKELQTDDSVTHFFDSQLLKQQMSRHAEFAGAHNEPRQSNGHLQRPNNNDPPQRTATVDVQERLGWNCEKCTFRNLPTFPFCKICMDARPRDFVVPDDYVMLQEEVERIAEEKRNEDLVLAYENQRRNEEQQLAQENYRVLLQALDQKLLPNQEDFECSICMDEVEKGNGVMLRDCLHTFCKDCLIGTITNSEDPQVNCPYNDGFACPAVITMQEIEELLPHEEYGKYLSKSLSVAERGAKDSFHCRSANCGGWCFFEDDVNNFMCPICNQNNCLTCKAIHPDQSCKEYQDDLKARAENDDAAKKTQAMLDELITRGEAMHCPQCKVILQKKQGCDWMRCTMCRCEICWATKGPRWGPGGAGDTSGGCKCGVNGRRCMPNCGNCH